MNSYKIANFLPFFILANLAAIPNCHIRDNDRCVDSSISGPRICSATICGDGIIDPNDDEECDDGNTLSGDGCNALCIVEECLNSEDCDDNKVCNGLERCIQGVCHRGQDVLSGAPCASGICNAGQCSESVCGDGIIDPNNDEECDDGNTVSGDGCNHDCLLPGTVARKLALVRLNYTDSIWSNEDQESVYTNINEMVFEGDDSLTAFLHQHFGNQINLQGLDEAKNDLVDLGLLDLPVSTESCGGIEAKQQLPGILEIAPETGITDILMIVEPGIRTGCPASGFATEMNEVDLLYLETSHWTHRPTSYVLFHEFLHGLGSGHSGLADLSSEEELDYQVMVYGDSESIMGGPVTGSMFKMNFVNRYMVAEELGLDIGAEVIAETSFARSLTLHDERTSDSGVTVGAMLLNAKHDLLSKYSSPSTGSGYSLAISFRALDNVAGDRLYIRRVSSNDSYLLDTLEPGEVFLDTRAGVSIDFSDVNEEASALVHVSKEIPSNVDCPTPEWKPSISTLIGTTLSSEEVLFELSLSHNYAFFNGCGVGLDMIVYLEVVDNNNNVRGAHHKVTVNNLQGYSNFALKVDAADLSFGDDSFFRVVASRVLTERDGLPFEFHSNELGPLPL